MPKPRSQRLQGDLREIHIFEGSRGLGCLQRHDLDAAGILDDIELADVDRFAVADFDQESCARPIHRQAGCLDG